MDLLERGSRQVLASGNGAHYPHAVQYIFLERIMTYTLDAHIGTVTIGGRQLAKLRFADNIDGFTTTSDPNRKSIEGLWN